ncbi:alpha/beta hydrolase [Streptomyces sp. NPDC020883]|uniref:alpha/beta hydrolase n=1 Tax=Streptomyces sp. NPDC020883 TaxID=3365099 RepID=UPI0037B78150
MAQAVDSRSSSAAAPRAADPARDRDGLRLAQHPGAIRPLVLALADRLDRAPRPATTSNQPLTGNLLRQAIQQALTEDAGFPNHPLRLLAQRAGRQAGPHHTGRTSNVLMIQNLRDPTTPYFGALRMRAALGRRARLVTVDHGGHGAYLANDNACGDRAVTEFLLSGHRPAADRRCTAQLGQGVAESAAGLHGRADGTGRGAGGGGQIPCPPPRERLGDAVHEMRTGPPTTGASGRVWHIMADHAARSTPCGRKLAGAAGSSAHKEVPTERHCSPCTAAFRSD